MGRPEQKIHRYLCKNFEISQIILKKGKSDDILFIPYFIIFILFVVSIIILFRGYICCFYGHSKYTTPYCFRRFGSICNTDIEPSFPVKSN